ncbi:MAG: hypothetical protein ACE5FG_11535 [Myxococcota bacterium]
MGYGEGSFEPEAHLDPAYPEHSPVDPLYPCQTLAPLGDLLGGVATPAIWSRIEAPLSRALRELWQRLGLLARGQPQHWVTLHCGRIALNAHGWERLCARYAGREPEPGLVAPPGAGLRRIPELWEGWRSRPGRHRLRARLRRAQELAERGLAQAVGRDPAELDAGELARGPLDERVWIELLLPWLALRLTQSPAGDLSAEPDAASKAAPARLRDAPDPCLRTAIALEQRFLSELGRRLVAQGRLDDPASLAYLSIAERIQVVHEGSGYWKRLAQRRCARIESYVPLELPVLFWGRPRVCREKVG